MAKDCHVFFCEILVSNSANLRNWYRNCGNSCTNNLGHFVFRLPSLHATYSSLVLTLSTPHLQDNEKPASLGFWYARLFRHLVQRQSWNRKHLYQCKGNKCAGYMSFFIVLPTGTHQFLGCVRQELGKNNKNS